MIPVYIIAYNRKLSLERLVQSVFASDIPIKAIVVSVDGGASREVVEYCDSLHLDFGIKIVQRRIQLGLRAHVLLCGDEIAETGGGVLLEDDLVVSRNILYNLNRMIERARTLRNCAQISLYSPETVTFSPRPFVPCSDAQGYYCCAMPSSWGQYWRSDWWFEFKDWLRMNGEDQCDETNFPKEITCWPKATSWLRQFTYYVWSTQKTCLYAVGSNTSNSGDRGTHFGGRNRVFQVGLTQLRLGEASTPDMDMPSYDIFFERDPLQLAPFLGLDVEDFSINFNELKAVESGFVLSFRLAKNSRMFGDVYFENERNVLMNVPGDGISLAPFSEYSKVRSLSRMDLYARHLPVWSNRELVSFWLNRSR